VHNNKRFAGSPKRPSLSNDEMALRYPEETAIIGSPGNIRAQILQLFSALTVGYARKSRNFNKALLARSCANCNKNVVDSITQWASAEIFFLWLGS
jgi:hypothetical protein